MNENVNDEAKARQALQWGRCLAQQVGVAVLKSVSLLPKDTELLHVCARVYACVKLLKSFMQRFSFRLPKQRVEIVASTRCFCCQLLLFLLLSVVVASCCCCCCCLGLLNCC